MLYYYGEFMGKIKQCALVCQSGGPTPAVNATLCGVIRGARDGGIKLYGAKNGILGVLENRITDLGYLFGSPRSLSRLSSTPGAALGSCRVRLPDDLDSAVYGEIFSYFDEHGVKYFFCIGGNDSMDTVAKLSAYAKKKSLDVSIIGIPKTIDNDLVLTDHTPGFGSAAKCVATAVCELWQDVSSYNVPSVTVLEVMGRDTGWLGCACALPYYRFGYGATLVYLPEGAFSLDRFLGDVERGLSQGTPLLVCVSEGVGAVGADGARDAFGHSDVSGACRLLAKEIKNNLRCKSRGVELSLMQRCASHMASATDISESEAIGEYSVSLALGGKSGKMSAFVRRQGEYGVDFCDVDAYLVANKTKYVPADFINSEGNFVTEKCIDYLSPLILGERDARFEFGMPKHFRLK